jgi:mycothiol synthase
MMPALTTTTTTGAPGEEVHRLLDAVAAADGRFPLSDHMRIELADGHDVVSVVAHSEDRLVGYAQLASLPATRTVELVIAEDHRGDSRVRSSLLAAALEVVAAAGGGPLQWWAFDASDVDRDAARAAGLAPTRTLLQLRRPLPTGLAVEVDTRPFVPGRDEDAFLAVNNRAFAGHPEQGGWTVDVLRQREREPWFDAGGFLLHERDGRLAGFCWTKLHDAVRAEDVVGEIYVVAVDPDFQGLGLGRQLTIAGLDAIARRGVTTGMLYVDAANVAALTMYERLGFRTHRTDIAFTGTVT